MHASRSAVALLCLGVVTAGGSAADADPQLAAQAFAVLKTNCARCHGPDGTNEGGMNYILDVKQLVERKKIVPGDPSKSKLFKRVAEDEMPPEDEKPRPSKEEVALLEKWIQAGAPAPAAPSAAQARAFRTAKDNLYAIREHLRRLPFQDRPYQRYFTLTNLHNNRAFKDAEIRLYRAALAKFMNHLSWKNAVVVPEPIDPDQTVFAVDIRRLDWDRCHLWTEILKVYPYGLRHDQDPDEEVQNIAREVYDLAGTDLPEIRADWFIATASRPPLYHTLLFETLMGLPRHFGARDVEYKLGVDVADNFLKDKLARAGFTTSGVSAQNRMIERHESPYGAYWKSYDFKSNEDRENLFVNPLGPVFRGNPYADHAFVQAGGEIIFNLPNGLQGYLLVNGKDQRIDKGPIEVVADSLRTGGTAEVTNGVSCMACHTNGMKSEFKDTVREGTSLGGNARIKVRRLYLPPEPMQRLVQEDQERFLTAANRAMGPFLKDAADTPKPGDATSEPIGVVARRHILRELNVEDAASEMGLAEPGVLQAAIRTNPMLRHLGLGPLGAGATIKREVWESLDHFTSAFQDAARTLELGTPKRVR